MTFSSFDPTTPQDVNLDNYLPVDDPWIDATSSSYLDLDNLGHLPPTDLSNEPATISLPPACIDSSMPVGFGLDMYLSDINNFDLNSTSSSLPSPVFGSVSTISSPIIDANPATPHSPFCLTELDSPSGHSIGSDSENSYRPETARKSRNSRAGRRRRDGAALPHNTIEKNYRDSVNAALQRLQRTVPCFSPSEADSDAPDFIRQPTKTAILLAAVEYIRQLQHERDSLRKESIALRSAVRRSTMLMEKVAMREAVVDVFAAMGKSA